MEIDRLTLWRWIREINVFFMANSWVDVAIISMICLSNIIFIFIVLLLSPAYKLLWNSCAEEMLNILAIFPSPFKNRLLLLVCFILMLGLALAMHGSRWRVEVGCCLWPSSSSSYFIFCSLLVLLWFLFRCCCKVDCSCMLYSGEGGREKHSFDEERSSQGRRSSNVASLGLSIVLVMTGGGCTELAIRWEKCKLFYFFMMSHERSYKI